MPDLSLPPYPGANLSPDSPANLHWVKVTGVIDTSFRGRFGTERFGLLQKKIEILPGRRLKQFLTVLAWFKNETRYEIEIEIEHPPTGSSFGVARGDMESGAVEKGKNIATAKTKTGTIIAHRVINNVPSSGFYDRDKHAYYFRVSENTIEPVPPNFARQHWRFYAMPDRD